MYYIDCELDDCSYFFGESLSHCRLLSEVMLVVRCMYEAEYVNKGGEVRAGIDEAG